MDEETKKLIDKVHFGNIHCSVGVCLHCPYQLYGEFCHEYKLADCVDLLLSDIPRDHSIIDDIRDILATY